MLEELQPEARRHLRRNFILGVASGSIFRFGDAFQDINLVLSVFVNRLSGSNLLVGFLQPVRFGGWFLPQLLLSARLQAAPVKLPYYRIGAILRAGSCFLLALAAFTVRDPKLLLGLTFLFLATFALSGGLTGLAFMDILGKTVPSRLRGRFFATRLFLGGILGLLASLVVRYVLSGAVDLPFPTNYALLFLLSGIGVGLSMTAYCFVREPPENNMQPQVGVLDQLRRASSLPRKNHDFRNFVLARVLLTVAGTASPFYFIYAQEEFGLPEYMIGTYLLISTVATIASTYFWGIISDRIGNRAVLRVVCTLGAVSPLISLAATPLVAQVGQGTRLPSLLFGLIFVVLGTNRNGSIVGGMNLLLDLAPADDRPIYIGFTNTMLGVASLTNIAGGAIIEILGYRSLFALSLVLYLAASVAIARVPEPRTAVRCREEKVTSQA